MRAAVVIAVILTAAGPARADREAAPRHQLGLQLGGTGPIQMVYRARVAGPLAVDLGIFGAPPWAMASAGLVAESPAIGRISFYAGAGAGGIIVVPEHRCAPADPQTCSDSGDWRYLHARAGLAVHLRDTTTADGRRARHRLAVDLGLWRGIARDRAAGRMPVERPFTIPMAGLSYLIGF